MGNTPFKHSDYFYLTKRPFQNNIWKNNILSKYNKEISEQKVEGSKVIFNIDLLYWTTQVLYENVANLSLEQQPPNFSFLNREQIVSMSTFLPDELIRTLVERKQSNSFVGALIFADLSGFTTLCEKYAGLGAEGSFRLTATLNAYLGSMVHIIYRCGGDLIKFGGDSFIAVWRLMTNEYLSDKVHQVIDCAIKVQNSLGSFVSDVEVALKVKIAISAGNFTFYVLGDDIAGSYVLYGAPILEAKQGESYCSSGDIVIAPSAYKCINKNNYLFRRVTKGFLKLKRILDADEINREKFEFEILQNIKSFKRPAMLKKLINSTLQSKVDIDEIGKSRPLLKSEYIGILGRALRPYVTQPVLYQIHLNSTFIPVTEMRQVTIIFIRFKPRTRLESEILKAANIAFCTSTNIVKENFGHFNKIAMYDKDVMLLAVFGMKGYKRKNDTHRALLSASCIRSALKNHHLIEDLSIGVTVGTPFCGVIGHASRKELTLIGRPVNKAARLMCKFKEMISCDLDVVKHSKLPLHNFKRLKSVDLKGLGKVKDVFQFNEIADPYRLPPLIGRSEIMSKYNDLLMFSNHLLGIIVMGESRMGKSRVISELEDKVLELGWNVLKVTIHAAIKNSICLLYRVLAAMMGKTVEERSSFLIRIFSEDGELYDKLYLFNNILDVNFPRNTKNEFIEEDEVDERNMFVELLRKLPNKTLLIVDDAHVLDCGSWMILAAAIDLPNIIPVVSAPITLTVKDNCIYDYFSNPSVITFRLDGLLLDDIGPLICQMIQVMAIPKVLPPILYNLSEGNPGWVQNFMVSYLKSNLLFIQNERREVLSPATYTIFPSTKFSRSDVVQSILQKSTYIPTCILTPELKRNLIPPLFDDLWLAMFDKLCEFDQMLLKCASIIGIKFQRNILMSVMEKTTEVNVCNAYVRLFRMSLLTCASVQQRRSSFNEIKLECNCQTQITSSIYPRYAFCKNTRFTYGLLRSSLYNVLPSNQRKEGHLTVVKKLKTVNRKCLSCKRNRNMFIYRKREIKNIIIIESKNLEIKFNLHIFTEYFKRATKCSCYEILREHFEDLIYHSDKAGLTIMMLKHLIDYAAEVLRFGIYTKTIQLLQKAKTAHQTYMDEIKKKKRQHITFTPVTEVKTNVKKSDLNFANKKICIHLAAAYINLGELHQAEEAISQINKDKNPILIIWSWLLYFTKTEMHMRRKLYVSITMKCELFVTLSKIALLKHNLPEARKCAAFSVLLVRGLKDTTRLSTVYTNYLDMATIISNMKYTELVEGVAIKRCLKYFKGEDLMEILSVTEIFGAVFKSRFFRGKLYRATTTGLATLTFAHFVEANDATFNLSCFIIQSHLKVFNFEDVAYILRKYIEDENTQQDMTYLTHIVNLEIFLETGLTWRSMKVTLKFLRDVTKIRYRTNDPFLGRKITISLYLLYLRKGFFSTARMYAVNDYLPGDLLPDNFFRLMKILEGSLLLYVQMIDEGFTDPYVKKDLKFKFRFIRFIRETKLELFYPQYYTYKGYYALLNFTKHKSPKGCIKYLRRAYNHAEKQGNRLAMLRIETHLKRWFDQSTNMQSTNQKHTSEPILLDSMLKLVSSGLSSYEHVLTKTLPVLPLPSIVQRSININNPDNHLYKKIYKLVTNET